MGHVSLTDYYYSMNRLVEHGYSKSDIDMMIPFERDVIITLLNSDVQSEAAASPAPPEEMFS